MHPKDLDNCEGLGNPVLAHVTSVLVNPKDMYAVCRVEPVVMRPFPSMAGTW